MLLELQWMYESMYSVNSITQTHCQTGRVPLFADSNELTFTLHHQQNLMLKHLGFREKRR